MKCVIRMNLCTYTPCVYYGVYGDTGTIIEALVHNMEQNFILQERCMTCNYRASEINEA